MNTVKIFIFNRILILLTICVIIMFYQYKIKHIKLQTFLIIPITLVIYYFFKLLNFLILFCLSLFNFTHNYFLISI